MIKNKKFWDKIIKSLKLPKEYSNTKSQSRYINTITL